MYESAGYENMVRQFFKNKLSNTDMPYPQLIKMTLEDDKNKGSINTFRKYIAEHKASKDKFQPFDELIEIMKKMYEDTRGLSDDDFSTNMYYFYYLQNWEIYSQVYRFDKSLFDTLTTNTEDINISVDIFNSLPYDTFFVENEIDDKYNHYIGFYVVREKNKCVSLCFVREDLIWFDTDIKLDRGNLPISHLTDNYEKLINNKNPNFVSDTQNLVKKILPVLLYLCADNSEIEKIKVQRAKKKKKGKSTAASKTLYTSNRVGYKIGAEIRQNKKRYVYENVSENKGKGTKKAAHFRKAHYHSFWVGKHNSDERRLIVKFLPPIYVNNNGDEEGISTVHKVK